MNATDKSRLLDCFSTVFPSLSEKQILNLDQAEFGQWDSLATVTLIAVIEEAFQVEIPVHEIQNLVSFESFQNIVTRTEQHSSH